MIWIKCQWMMIAVVGALLLQSSGQSTEPYTTQEQSLLEQPLPENISSSLEASPASPLLPNDFNSSIDNELAAVNSTHELGEHHHFVSVSGGAYNVTNDNYSVSEFAGGDVFSSLDPTAEAPNENASAKAGETPNGETKAELLDGDKISIEVKEVCHKATVSADGNMTGESNETEVLNKDLTEYNSSSKNESESPTTELNLIKENEDNSTIRPSQDTEKIYSSSPKSATKKRSVNSTRSTTSNDELVTASSYTDSLPSLTSIFNTTLDTLISNGYSSESDFSENNHVNDGTKSSSYFQDPSAQPFETLNTVSGLSESPIRTEGIESASIPIYVPHNRSEAVLNESIYDFEEHVDSGPVGMASEFVEHEIEPENSSREFINSVVNTGERYGVTFDPDGMTHTGPQDPDSLIFSASSHSSNGIVNTDAISEMAIPQHETELETNMGKEINPNESASNQKVDLEDRESDDVDTIRKDSKEFESVENATGQGVTHGLQHIALSPSISGSSIFSISHERNESSAKFQSMVESDDSEEMMNDSPQFFPEDMTQSNSFTSSTTGKSDKLTENPVNHGANSRPELESSTVLAKVDVSQNSSLAHQTELSAIRPLKVTPPTFETTSVQPDMLQATNAKVTSDSTSESGTSGARVVLNDTLPETSSPVFLPNPAPSVTEKVEKIPTMVMKPELSTDVPELLLNGTSTDNFSSSNSTISGVEFKKSVSDAVPLSNHESVIQNLGNSTDSTPIMMPKIVSFSPDAISNSTPESSTGLTIRKPTPSVRSPYVPAWRRPATTAGPPVAIFKKQRTRLASITSSTTARPFNQFSTLRVASRTQHGMLPGETLYISTAPVTTTTTTEAPTTTEEPISEVPFTDTTHVPTIADDSSDVTLLKVAGTVVLDRGLRWDDQLHNRHSPEYKRKANLMHLHLERLFRSSPIASRIWRIEIDGFSGNKEPRSVAVDFFLYLIKSSDEIETSHLATVFHERLTSNNTFFRFRVDTSKTTFERVREEPLHSPTFPPEGEGEGEEPPIPQWAIAVIVVAAASLVFILLFAAVTVYGRHRLTRRHMRKLSEEEASSGGWESKMAAAYENMAADTIYDAHDLPYPTAPDTASKQSRIATFHGRPSTLRRCDSWSDDRWQTAHPRRHGTPTR